jgi:hypothetical protein
MKRALTAVAAAAIVAGTMSGTAGAKVAPASRTLEAEYVTPAVGVSPQEGTKAYFYDCKNGIGCALLELGPKDRYATIEIDDAAGQQAYGVVYRVPGFDVIGDFCGSTGEAWPTGGADELLVHVVPGACESGEPSVATTGVVRATVSTRR